MSEKIKVIKCLSEEHGKRIIPEAKPMSELEALKQQKAEIEKRIADLERQPETFEGIIEMLDDDNYGLDYESIEELEKISQHSYLYDNLKRIELYVNKRFGGEIINSPMV